MLSFCIFFFLATSSPPFIAEKRIQFWKQLQSRLQQHSPSLSFVLFFFSFFSVALRFSFHKFCLHRRTPTDPPTTSIQVIRFLCAGFERKTENYLFFSLCDVLFADLNRDAFLSVGQKVLLCIGGVRAIVLSCFFVGVYLFLYRLILVGRLRLETMQGFQNDSKIVF